MKRILITSLLILSLILALASCGGCDEHIDKDKDGKCDECDTEVGFPVPDDEDTDKDSTDGTDDTEGEDNTDKPEAPKAGNKVGNTCFDLDIDLLLSDGTINIEDYRGKVVVLNFWGTWCGPCKSELPHFSDLASEMSDDLVIIAVHSGPKVGMYDPAAYDVTTKLEGTKIIFAEDTSLANGADKYYSLLGGTGAYPYTLVLDRNGVITYKQSGALSYDDLKLLVEAAAAEQ